MSCVQLSVPGLSHTNKACVSLQSVLNVNPAVATDCTKHCTPRPLRPPPPNKKMRRSNIQLLYKPTFFLFFPPSDIMDIHPRHFYIIRKEVKCKLKKREIVGNVRENPIESDRTISLVNVYIKRLGTIKL